MGVRCARPPIDTVPSELQVDVLAELAGLKIETIEEAIEVYMEAYNQKFHYQERKRQRKRSLTLFQQYLAAQGHSLKLKDLTFADGQSFLDSLMNRYNGQPLSLAQKQKYCSALCSFSRFLCKLGIIQVNVFFPLKIK